MFKEIKAEAFPTGMKKINFIFGKGVVIFNAMGREACGTFSFNYWFKMFCSPFLNLRGYTFAFILLKCRHILFISNALLRISMSKRAERVIPPCTHQQFNKTCCSFTPLLNFVSTKNIRRVAPPLCEHFLGIHLEIRAHKGSILT